MKRCSTWFIISKTGQNPEVTGRTLHFIPSVISFWVIGFYWAEQWYGVIYILDNPSSFCVEAIIYEVQTCSYGDAKYSKSIVTNILITMYSVRWLLDSSGWLSNINV